jgi:hypothetical protein
MEQVKGYSGAQHRAFFDEADACSYLIGYAQTMWGEACW